MDPILYWNDVALEANRVSHTDGKDTGTLGPTLSSRALAIVHLAMYDACIGVMNASGATSLSPYLTGLATPATGATVDASVAAAAHLTLSTLYPSQRGFFDQKLQGAGVNTMSSDPGIAFGLQVAQQMMVDRMSDPSASDVGYMAPTGRGQHQPDPDNAAQGFYAPFYGAGAKCFAVTQRHALDAPPFDDVEYRTALKQVRGKGIKPELMGTLPFGTPRRNSDETLIGLYWGYDGAAGLGTPPRFYNQIIRQIVMARMQSNPADPKNSVDQVASLFALVNAAMADAGILAWEQKYLHNLWRPVVGIRQHDKSMGATGQGNNDISNDCDINWLPLGAPKTNGTVVNGLPPKNFTPNFPAYPSGHATFGAAAFQIARLFYGESGRGPDQLVDGLNFVSEEFNGVNKDNLGAVRPYHLRNFPGGLWRMIIENGRSRLYLGVHWVFDAFAVDENDEPDLTRNIGGVPLGLQIAEDIYAHYTGVSGSSTGSWKSNV